MAGATGSWCATCGPDVDCDEDGCCAVCGNDATGPGADEAQQWRADAMVLVHAWDHESSPPNDVLERGRAALKGKA